MPNANKIRIETKNPLENNKRRYNLQSLFNDSNNPDTLKRTLQLVGVHLDWKRAGNGFRAGKTGRHSIFNKNGKWLYTDFSAGETFTAWSLIKKHGFQNIEQNAETLAAAIGTNLSYYVESEYTATTKPRQKRRRVGEPIAQPLPEVHETPFVPNVGGGKTSGTAYAVPYETAYGQRVAKHLYHKTGARPDFLKWYGVHPVWSAKWAKYGGIEQFNFDNPAYLYHIGQSVKLKRIKPKGRRDGTKQPKTVYLQFGGNYVFGFDQLPEQCNKIIICAGEDDVLTLNNALNNLGVFAICLSGEGANIQPAFLTQLKERCNEVLIWYDNDETGTKQAKKWANKYGLRSLYHSGYTSDFCKDVSDVHALYGAEKVVEIFQTENKYRRVVTRSGVTVPDVFSIEIDKYISEHEGAIIGAINKFDKLQISAPTGSGKTYGIRSVLNNPALVGCNSTVLCVPTRAIADQQAYELGVPNVQSGTSETEIHEALHTKKAVCTYDSLPKLRELFDTGRVCLIMDESHEIIDAFSYRKEAIKRVFLHIRKAHKNVFLSGTPNLLMSIDGFKHVEFTQQNGQRFNIQPYGYKKGMAADLAIIIGKKHKKGEGVSFVRYNDVNGLEACQMELEKFGLKSFIVASKRDKYNDSEDLKTLLKTGFVPEGYDVVLTTAKLDTGVSIKTKIQHVHLISPETANEARQFIARARMDWETGTNASIDVSIYHTLETTKNVLVERALDIEADYQKFHDLVVKSAENANEQHELFGSHARRANLENDHLVFDDELGMLGGYVPDVAGILTTVTNRFRSSQGYAGFLGDLRALGCTVSDVMELDLSGIEAEKVETEKPDLSTAFEIVAQNPLDVLGAVLSTTKNRSLRHSIRKTSSEAGETIPEAQPETVDKIGHEMANVERLTGALCGLIESGATVPQAGIWIGVCNSDGKLDRTAFRVLRAKITADRTLQYNGKDGLLRKQRKQYQELKAALSGHIGQTLTGGQLSKIVRGIFGAVNPNTVPALARSVFCISKVQNKTNRSFDYTINRPETLADFVNMKKVRSY